MTDESCQFADGNFARIDLPTDAERIISFEFERLAEGKSPTAQVWHGADRTFPSEDCNSRGLDALQSVELVILFEY
jgi:hypothetical protein